jgi:hypothetical protein
MPGYTFKKRRSKRQRVHFMDVRAAVAIAAGKPLEITTVQLEGPARAR